MAAPVVLIGLVSRTMEVVAASALVVGVGVLIGLTALAAVLRALGVPARARRKRNEKANDAR